MLIGVAWALWHLPLMGTEFRWNNVPAFLLSVFAGSVVAAWWVAGAAAIAWRSGPALRSGARS